MHESAPLTKKAEQAVDKALGAIESPVEKLEALDAMVKRALTSEEVANAAILEFGTDVAKNTYMEDTPGQVSTTIQRDPTQKDKASHPLAIDGVPAPGGEIKKQQVFTTAGINEEEQINELSRDTLASYQKKASDARGHRGLPTAKVDNRYKGVSQASKKLNAKESVESVDEVSDATKTSYIKKAGQEVTSREKVKIANKGWTGKTGDTITKYHDDKINKRHKGIRAARGSLKMTVSEVASMITVDESMSVTLRKSKSQPGSYKVHSVGSKMKAHGGMKPGERVQDHHIDDLHDSGIKVKYHKEGMSDHQKGLIESKFSSKEIKMAAGVANDKRYKGGNYSGAYKVANKIKPGLGDHPKVQSALRKANEDLAKKLFGVHLDEISNKLVKKVGVREANLPEAIERRADRKTILATDPNTGKKFLKIAPRKQIEIGLGKDA